MEKRIKTIVWLMLTLALCLSVVGCATTPVSNSPASAVQTTPASSSPAKAAPTTPASGSVDKVLLVVSFGTSYNDNRDLSIGAVETALQAAYPDYKVRRAFTSQIIIDKLAKRDGLKIDNVTQAMDRLVADGVKEVIIQPTHVMSGFEYDDVVAEVTPYAAKFKSFKIGKSLLITDADYDELISSITKETKDYDVDGTAIVFMGHGTEHEANATYAKIQQRLTDKGYARYVIGTVEAKPDLEDAIALAKKTGATKVVLLPLMIVAGDHANNDMAGDEEDSWKTLFQENGFKVETVLKGLGQYKGIQDLIVEHAGQTIAQ